MSTINNRVSLDCAYKNTDFTRRYSMNGVSAAQLPLIESAVNAINSSIAAGTAGSLTSVFVSDDFDPSNDIGTLTKIERAVITSTEEIPIAWG